MHATPFNPLKPLKNTIKNPFKHLMEVAPPHPNSPVAAGALHVERHPRVAHIWEGHESAVTVDAAHTGMGILQRVLNGIRMGFVLGEF